MTLTLVLGTTLLFPNGFLATGVARDAPPPVSIHDENHIRKVAFVKRFLVFLRRTHEPVAPEDYRSVIDPEYFQVLDDPGNAQPMRTAPVLGIEDIQLALDGSHAIAIVRLNDGSSREVWLLQVVERDGAPFIRPPSTANRDDSGSFAPWKLRVPIPNRDAIQPSEDTPPGL